MQGNIGVCGVHQLSDYSTGALPMGGANELKTQFCTREGEYRLQPLCEYGRPNRVGAYNSQTNTPVKISFIQDSICYNVGRELYIFSFKGARKAADLSKPIDKKVYKGSYPTCHDFNQMSYESLPSSPSSSTARTSTPNQQETSMNNSENATKQTEGADHNDQAALSSPLNADHEGSDSLDTLQQTNNECPPYAAESSPSFQLLVGFSAGQIQIVDPAFKDYLKSKLFNDERLIDRTKVTSLAWVPLSTQLFLVSHASGQMYLYKNDYAVGTQAPNYQLFKTGQGYSIYTCRSKQTRNPLFRWIIGEGSLNSFAFSPGEGKYLATVSQDGFMRCFEYASMELIGSFRSYFGGLICVSWSPDSRYVLCGGEDDLVTLWSLVENRVVARGQGHNSWVNCVQFDPYLCTDGNYRFGSVGQDTQLCLWDICENDMLKQPKNKKSTLQNTVQNGSASFKDAGEKDFSNKHQNNNSPIPQNRSRDHKENSNVGSKEKDNLFGGLNSGNIAVHLGSAQCPRLNQVPMLEPLVCKKISAERLTALHFREDSLVTACQEGFVCTWARPGVRLESGDRRNDFGITVSAAFIDGDLPSSSTSLNSPSCLSSAAGKSS